MNTIEEVVKDKNAKLQIVKDIDVGQIRFSGLNTPLFQLRNWNLADKVCNFISERDDFKLNNTVDALKIVVPGRMETFKLDDGTLLIMDGSHNGQKIATFVDSFREKYPFQDATILLALKSGKEYIEVIDRLSEIAKYFILTTFSSGQDLPAMSVDPQTLKDYCDKKYISSVIIREHVEAYEKLLTSNSKIKLVIGSFYLLGQIRK
jgi:folylpolyglutamate synthase/dihydropteroate synthase